MALDFDKIITDRILFVSVYDRANGALLARIDEIREGSFENGSEKVFGTGAAGKRLSSLNRNKTARFSCTNGLVSAGTLAVQMGTTATDSTSISVSHSEIITVGATVTSVLTTYTATGTAGAEIKLYFANSDLSKGTEIEQAAAASTTEFAYAPGTKTITLPTSGITEGMKVIANYDYNSKAKKISNNTNNFPPDAKVVVDVLCKDICDSSARIAKFIIPNGSIDGNATISIGNEPAAHNFACDCLAGYCGDGTYWDFYVLDGEAS